MEKHGNHFRDTKKKVRLIDADELLTREVYYDETKCLVLRHEIDNAPTVDVVSRGVHDQVRWERDVAIEQLEEHGIPFGGIAPDVVKVVRCKDCRHYDNSEGICWCKLNSKFFPGGMDWHGFPEDGFCSYGERKDNEK